MWIPNSMFSISLKKVPFDMTMYFVRWRLAGSINAVFLNRSPSSVSQAFTVFEELENYKHAPRFSSTGTSECIFCYLGQRGYHFKTEPKRKEENLSIWGTPFFGQRWFQSNMILAFQFQLYTHFVRLRLHVCFTLKLGPVSVQNR